MGSVHVDIYKREKSLAQAYPLRTSEGVLAFLENFHYFKEQRLKGDIESSTMLLDFIDAYEKTQLSGRERECLYYRYQECLSLKETADILGISFQAVNVYTKRGVERIANYLAETEGYADESVSDR